MSDKKLTAKQEKAAALRADGMDQAEAYRQSYDVSENSKPETIWADASRLFANPLVAARVEELKAQLAAKSLWTREMSVKALAKAYRVAEQGANASGMTGAVKELNAMHGFNEPQKIDVSGGIGVQLVRRVIVDKDDS